VRPWKTSPRPAARALHARGGGPEYQHCVPLAWTCSPRTWRWSVRDQITHRSSQVLSTHVEVVRHPVARSLAVNRALHARGGGPFHTLYVVQYRGCSPRTWRWSVPYSVCSSVQRVLSTHVEVVRRPRNGGAPWKGALHARGGGLVWQVWAAWRVQFDAQLERSALIVAAIGQRTPSCAMGSSGNPAHVAPATDGGRGTCPCTRLALHAHVATRAHESNAVIVPGLGEVRERSPGRREHPTAPHGDVALPTTTTLPGSARAVSTDRVGSTPYAN